MKPEFANGFTLRTNSVTVTLGFHIRYCPGYEEDCSATTEQVAAIIITKEQASALAAGLAEILSVIDDEGDKENEGEVIKCGNQ